MDIEKLAQEIAKYVYNVDTYEFNDEFGIDGMENCIESIKEQLSTKKGISGLVNYFTESIEEMEEDIPASKWVILYGDTLKPQTLLDELNKVKVEEGKQDNKYDTLYDYILINEQGYDVQDTPTEFVCYVEFTPEDINSDDFDKFVSEICKLAKVQRQIDDSTLVVDMTSIVANNEALQDYILDNFDFYYEDGDEVYSIVTDVMPQLLCGGAPDRIYTELCDVLKNGLKESKEVEEDKLDLTEEDTELLQYLYDECEGDEEWIPDYEDVTDMYSSDVSEEEYNKVCNILKDLLKDVVVYEDDLELSSNHTLYDLDKSVEISDTEYETEVGFAIDQLSEELGQDVYCLGRSGRHICIANTLDNLINYKKYKAIQKEAEDNFVKYINNNYGNVKVEEDCTQTASITGPVDTFKKEDTKLEESEDKIEAKVELNNIKRTLYSKDEVDCFDVIKRTIEGLEEYVSKWSIDLLSIKSCYVQFRTKQGDGEFTVDFSTDTFGTVESVKTTFSSQDVTDEFVALAQQLNNLKNK